MTGVASSFASACLDLIFPRLEFSEPLAAPIERPFCEQCGEPTQAVVSASFVCANCEDRTWSLAWARAAYPFKGVVRRVILENKYQGEFHHLDLMIPWLEEGFRRHAAHIAWDALVVVPLYPVRQRERGFNQSLELARGLGKRQKIPVWDCLRRVQPTPKQSTLGRSQRLRNLYDAFALKSRFDVSRKSLLLIDDVFTTGATGEACARLLKQHQAATVAILTLARA